MSDSELLRKFAEAHDESALADLVRRRVALVHGAARRSSGDDPRRAEQITRDVFIELARNARALAAHDALLDWLFSTTRNVAAEQARTSPRRPSEKPAAADSAPAISNRENNWDAIAPVLDAALAELEAPDRRVLLQRYLDGQTYLRIGEQLGVTETIAQKRAEHALDELQSALGRRGIRTTSAGLGAVLTERAASAAPPGLAAAVASAALLAMPAGDGRVRPRRASLVTGFVAVVVVMIMVAATFAAFTEHRRARDAQRATAAAEQQRNALRSQLAALEERAQRAEQRATEAEKDNGELLKLIESFRGLPGQTAATASAATPTAATASQPGTLPAAERDDEEAKELARWYQQDLARRRADEAKQRAAVDAELAPLSEAEKFHRLIGLAAAHASNAEFQAGVRRFNEAMAVKPADVPVGRELRELQAVLKAENAPVTVTLTSDGETYITIPGVRPPVRAGKLELRVMPGNYEVIGRRKGYQDVVVPLQVRATAPPQPIPVACTTRTGG